MKYVKYTLLGLLGLIILLLVWGVIIEPRLIDVKEEVAQIPNLPAAWEGEQVALIADFQIGMWLNNTDTIRRIVSRLVEKRPAAVLIAGDFVYNPTEDERDEVEWEDYIEFTEEINGLAEIVRPLPEAGIPTYAVLGNHDYGLMTPEYTKNELLARNVYKSLEAVGVMVLENEAVPLEPPGNHNPPKKAKSENLSLYLVGIGSHRANNDKPAVALAQVPDGAPRLMMMHNPDSFALFPAGTAPLALAGHTHGGQIRIPFTPKWSWMSLIRGSRVAADGWIDGYGQPGNHLYVNRGIGFSVIPVRINCPPELTLFTLQRVD